MNYRRFGRTGWQVSDIGYGMWGMGGAWKGSDDEEALASLQRSVDLGCNFFDTAWGYGAGHSEGLLGQIVRANPDKRLYTATKMPPKNFKWPSVREFTLDDCFPPDHIEQYVHSSLKNAGLESFDLMQFHTWEDSWLPDDRWAKKLDELRSQGLIGAIGISLNRWEPWNGVQTVRSGLIDAVQVIYNIFDQNPEDELFPACREHDVAVIARVPFDEGTLTGNLTKDSTWPEGDWRNAYFRAGEPRPQRRACRAAQTHRCSRGADDARYGAALHPEQPRRQHHHSGDAEDSERRSQHRLLRRRPAAGRSLRTTAPLPLGPPADRVVTVRKSEGPPGLSWRTFSCTSVSSL